MTRSYIPFHRPNVTERDVEAVAAALRSGWLTSGPLVRELEASVQKCVGAKGAVATNSCTAALHVALRALDVGPGAEVVVPTWTFCATANVVELLGARVRLVDVDGDLNIDPRAVARVLTDRTKAVIAVHVAGHAARLDELRRVCSVRGVPIIEDAAHALGSSFPDGVPVGHSGSVAFSFYATKVITTAEGGMLVSDDAAMLERVRTLVLHGMTAGAWSRYARGGKADYDVLEPGYKYNLSDMQAALGVEQLKRLDEGWTRRAQIARTYFERLVELAPAIGLPREPFGGKHSWHLFIIRVDGHRVKGGRDALAAELASDGIGTSVHFRPVHTFTYYRRKYGHAPKDFPVAEAAFEQVLSLPIFPDLDDEAVTYVSDSVHRAVRSLS